MTTDEAVKLVVGAIEDAVLRLHESHDFQVEVTYADAPEGKVGLVEFRELATEREWFIEVGLTSDPT